MQGWVQTQAAGTSFAVRRYSQFVQESEKEQTALGYTVTAHVSLSVGLER